MSPPSDADLKDLGFSLGHRRLLCKWIGLQQNSVQLPAHSGTQQSPSSSASSVSMNDLSDASLSTPARSSVARRPQASQFKVFILFSIQTAYSDN